MTDPDEVTQPYIRLPAGWNTEEPAWDDVGIVLECECGAHAIGVAPYASGHSTYCPVYYDPDDDVI